jgi:hypothetical protein
VWLSLSEWLYSAIIRFVSTGSVVEPRAARLCTKSSRFKYCRGVSRRLPSKPVFAVEPTQDGLRSNLMRSRKAVAANLRLPVTYSTKLYHPVILDLDSFLSTIQRSRLGIKSSLPKTLSAFDFNSMPSCHSNMTSRLSARISTSFALSFAKNTVQWCAQTSPEPVFSLGLQVPRPAWYIAD